jgi:hypothetical protein
MFWGKLFGRLITRDDPVFGRLLFMDTQDPSKSYWEGKGLFSTPEGRFQIDHFIEADASGPSQAQRDFYLEVAKRYSQVLEMSRCLLDPVFHVEHDRHLPARLEEEFAVSSISLPRLKPDDLPANWELCLKSKSTATSYCVTFNKWESVNISVDE